MPPPYLMTEQICVFVTDPKEALTAFRSMEHDGPIREDHPNIRAALRCPCCAQVYIWDFMDSSEWGGEGEGEVTYVPLGSHDKAALLDMPREELLEIVPRLSVPGNDPAAARWVTA